MSIPLVLKTDNVDFYANTSKILTTTNCTETVTMIVNGILNPPFQYDGNVNNYANLDYLLSTNGYSDPNNFSISLAAKNVGYWELLYKSNINGKFYDYVSTKNDIQSIVADDYIIENTDVTNVEFIIKNDNRYTVMNQTYFKIDNDIVSLEFPKYKNIPFLNKSTGQVSGLYAKLELTTTVSSISEQPYNNSLIDRTSAYVYEPGNVVYLLVNISQEKIYAMQTFKNKNKDIGLENIIYLGKYLSDPSYASVLLPSNFIFTHVKLDDKTMIVSMANPNTRQANVLTDGLQNNYQYIRRDEAPFLYNSIFPPP